MNAALVVLVIAALIGLGVLYVVRASQLAMLRERLSFGLDLPGEGAGDDLTAGDYGLAGADRLGYHFALFMGSWRGRALVAVLAGAAGFGIAYAQGRKLDASITLSVASSLAMTLGTMAYLYSRRRRRERRIRKALPDMLELVAAIMEGGIAFETALQHVVRDADLRHPLYFELSVMLEAMRRGRRRHEALRLFGERCNIVQVAEIVSSLTQADQTGSSIATVLRHHARTLFREYEAEVQRQAERLPIRMMFPMLVTILPAMFIVTGLPSLLRIYRVMESIIASRPG